MMIQTNNAQLSFKRFHYNVVYNCANDSTLSKRTLYDSQLDVNNLCSKKILELLTAPQQLTRQQQQAAQHALISRRHYLTELDTLRLQTH